MSSSITSRGLNRRYFLASLGAVSTLGVLTACNPAVTGEQGGGGGDATAVLNVGQISDSVAFFPLFVAEQQGFFAEENVTLGDRPRLGTGAKLAAALRSGSIDLGAGVITDAFNLASVDNDARLVSSLVSEYYVDVVVGTGFSGADADSSLEEKVNALVGKNIGITGPGSGTEALLTYLFRLVGKDAQRDATLVNLGATASAAVGALTAGRVDALSFFQPIGQMVETNGDGSILISPQRGDVPELAGALHGVVFSSQGLIEQKAEQVAGFNRAIDKALAFIRDDREAARDLLEEYLQQTSAPTLDAMMEILPEEIAESSSINQEAYNAARTFHLESGLVEDAPEYDGFVYEGAAG